MSEREYRLAILLSASPLIFGLVIMTWMAVLSGSWFPVLLGGTYAFGLVVILGMVIRWNHQDRRR